MTGPIPKAYAYAHARLARNHVVGMISYQADDRDYNQAAFKRFVEICRPPKGEELHWYKGMIYTLQNGRATINFSVKNFFLKPCPYENYINTFERVASGIGATHSVKPRDEVEKRLFDYQGKARYRPAPPGGNVAAVRQQIAHYGSNWRAYPMMRPRYAALDYAYYRHGGAGTGYYGTSFFVLKEYMKTVGTYCHCDTFAANNDLRRRRHEYGGQVRSSSETIARYHEMPKLLYYLHPFTLKEVYAYTTGQKQYLSEAYVPKFPDSEKLLSYIEIQLHSDVVFSRDIDYMVISRSDLFDTAAPFVHEAYQRDQIIKHAESFAYRHGFRMYMVE